MLETNAPQRIGELVEAAYRAWNKYEDDATFAREAKDLVGALLQARKGDATQDRSLIKLCVKVGTLLVEIELLKEGRALLDVATSLISPLCTADPTDLELRGHRYDIGMAAGIPIFGLNYPKEAELSLAEVVGLTKQTVTENPHEELWRRRRVTALVLLARFLAEQDRPVDARPHLCNALTLLDQLHVANPEGELRKTLASGYRDIGVLYSGMGRWVQARHCAGRCAPLLSPDTGSFRRGVIVDDRLSIAERLREDDPRNPEWKLYSRGVSGIGYHSSGYGNTQLNSSTVPDGIAIYMQDVSRFNNLPTAKQNHACCRRDLSLLHERIGHLHEARDEPTEALAAFEACCSLRQGLVHQDPEHAQWQRDLVVIKAKMGLIAYRLGMTAQAREAFETGRLVVSNLMEIDPALAPWYEDLLWFDHHLAECG